MKYYRGFFGGEGRGRKRLWDNLQFIASEIFLRQAKDKIIILFFPQSFQYGRLRQKKLFVGMRSVRNCVGRALFEQFWATRNSTVYRAGTGLINWEATASLPAAAAPSIPAKKRCIFLRWSICAAKLWLKQCWRCHLWKLYLKWNQRRIFLFFGTRKIGSYGMSYKVWVIPYKSYRWFLKENWANNN